jgi:hypothetical protein
MSYPEPVLDDGNDDGEGEGEGGNEDENILPIPISQVKDDTEDSTHQTLQLQWNRAKPIKETLFPARLSFSSLFSILEGQDTQSSNRWNRSFKKRTSGGLGSLKYDISPICIRKVNRRFSSTRVVVAGDPKTGKTSNRWNRSFEKEKTTSEGLESLKYDVSIFTPISGRLTVAFVQLGLWLLEISRRERASS